MQQRLYEVHKAFSVYSLALYKESALIQALQESSSCTQTSPQSIFSIYLSCYLCLKNYQNVN